MISFYTCFVLLSSGLLFIQIYFILCCILFDPNEIQVTEEWIWHYLKKIKSNLLSGEKIADFFIYCFGSIPKMKWSNNAVFKFQQ